MRLSFRKLNKDRGLYLKQSLGHGRVFKDAFACLQADGARIWGSWVETGSSIRKMTWKGVYRCPGCFCKAHSEEPIKIE